MGVETGFCEDYRKWKLVEPTAGANCPLTRVPVKKADFHCILRTNETRSTMKAHFWPRAIPETREQVMA